MGRYYSGDIEGKFWFGIQSSDDASFFGGDEMEANTITYFFEEHDLPDIERGLATCRDKLSVHHDTITAFFRRRRSYNDREVANALNISKSDVGGVLEWYARLQLGEKLHAQVKSTGSCVFEAELS